MARHVHFVTPENIEVSYELAGIGSRFLAALIDHLIQLVLLIGVRAVMSLTSGIGFFTGDVVGGTASKWATAIFILAAFVILFGYHTACELLMAGRTPGKALFGLRVVRDNGYPIDPYASIVRNLVRLLDLLLPPPYGAGLVCLFFSREYKRLGDYAAGTLVIKERPLVALTLDTQRPTSPLALQFMPYITHIEALTGEEFQLVRSFLDRRATLDLSMQGYLAMRIAQPLLPRIGILFAIPVQQHYVDLLEAIERKYVEERGAL